jgi:hypothetical protein
MFDDYWIAIIIITIVGFAITIALSFYFIFIPSQRAATQFSDIVSQGQQTLQDITDLINTDTQLAQEIREDNCKSLVYTAITITNKSNGACILSGQCPCVFIPQFCCQYLPTGACDPTVILSCNPDNICM